MHQAGWVGGRREAAAAGTHLLCAVATHQVVLRVTILSSDGRVGAFVDDHGCRKHTRAHC